jgi:hypothetical protein
MAASGKAGAFLGLVATAFFSSIASLAAQTYAPPAISAPLLRDIDFSKASSSDFDDYRQQFVNCDGDGPADIRDKVRASFRGYSVVRPKMPEDDQYYLCPSDRSNLRALLRLEDEGIYWHSKMALDYDGSWVTWTPGIQDATAQKTTAIQWPDVADPQASQIDPDRYPYIVIPGFVPGGLIGDHAVRAQLGDEFRSRTHLMPWDMGIVIYEDKWTPVFIADTGPFMKIGEASVRVFEELGQSRCLHWDSAKKTRCVGKTKGELPYENSGIPGDVLFIAWPNSAKAGDLTPDNAIRKICDFAMGKLKSLPVPPICKSR